MRRLTIATAALGVVLAQGLAAEPSGPVMQVPANPAPVTPAPPPATVVMPAPAPVVVDNALPPMNFYASVAGNELYDKIKAAAPFAHVEKELVGSPIQLRVTHSIRPTAGGQAAGLLSAIWAGSTLGLLPVVTNNNFVLTYEIRVNGKEVARYDFQRSFTRAINIWSEKNDATYGLGADGLQWALSTADEFTAKAAQDPALQALKQEYAFYFGPQPAA
jgi:hypothetical protein